jgi:Integrase zinc binding domain
MSRLKPSVPEVAIPSDPVDVEIPCFALTEERKDPNLLLVEDLFQLQAEDSSYRDLTNDITRNSSLDFEVHGVLGRTLPSVEFQVLLPQILHSITLIERREYPHDLEVHGYIHHLRRRVNTDFSASCFAHYGNTVATVREDFLQAIQMKELIRDQAEDPECIRAARHTGADSLINYNEHGVLVRRAPLDGSIQILVPASLRPNLLHLEHFPRTAGHPGITRMFRLMRKNYFWSERAHDVAETVRNCSTCAKNRVKERKRTSFLKLFPASGPLEYVFMDILCPLPKTDHGNRFLLVITDRFSELTRTVPLRTITALVVAKAFCENCVFAYGAPRYVLTDK